MWKCLVLRGVLRGVGWPLTLGTAVWSSSMILALGSSQLRVVLGSIPSPALRFFSLLLNSRMTCKEIRKPSRFFCISFLRTVLWYYGKHAGQLLSLLYCICNIINRVGAEERHFLRLTKQ